MKAIPSFLFYLFWSLIIHSQIINVPGDQPTIQAGINAASNGDTVLVNEGRYYEGINYFGKRIVVASHYIIDGDETHIDSTIIDGSQLPSNNATVVSFKSGEDTTSVIYGFTITGGKGSPDPYGYGLLGAGGIVLNFSGAKIQYNKIVHNTIIGASASGGGIVIAEPNNSVLILNNRIKNNYLLTTVPNSMGGGGIFCYNSEEHTILIAENIIADNKVMESDERISGYGGGVFISGSKVEIRNNLIINNIAQYGGGILIQQNLIATRPIIINNTIVNNYSEFGGGILSSGPMTNILNSIIWGNKAVIDEQISGSVLAEFSNIEDGYAGVGNISQNPLFTDTINYYLDVNSPCIDAGNDQSIFNDIEDPDNLGYALFPAMGTLRNDIGKYGGNRDRMFQDDLAGPKFRQFVNSVNRKFDNEQKQTVIDSFMNATNRFPFIDDNNVVYFLYQGNVQKINVPCDANNWSGSAYPMKRIEGTLLWYSEAVFQLDARIDYKYVLNENQWILDPLNPNTVTGGYGPNSELAMPEYIQPSEIIFNPDIDQGTVKDTLFFSEILDNNRTVRVYTPPGYDDNKSVKYPIMLFHDGIEFVSLGSAINVINNLTAEKRINPIIAIFVPPIDREEEYATNKTSEFSSFIIDEVMPFIDSEYHTILDPKYRAMAGISYGGLISTQICYQNPQTFGLCAAYSPSYWAKEKAVFNEVINGMKKDIKFYVDWGSYEGSITTDSKILVNNLFSKGYDVKANEWNEGHSWGSWRAHLDIALEDFFPFDSITSVNKDMEILSQDYSLSQNYPNPFNPSTTIKYSIPKQSNVTLKVFDVLGCEITTLVNKEQLQGNYEVELNGSDLTSGIYFYRIIAGDFVETKKMIYLK